MRMDDLNDSGYKQGPDSLLLHVNFDLSTFDLNRVVDLAMASSGLAIILFELFSLMALCHQTSSSKLGNGFSVRSDPPAPAALHDQTGHLVRCSTSCMVTMTTNGAASTRRTRR